MRIGFDNDKYVRLQSEKIQERMNKFGGKLYMEFGGKLFDDHHASRVLPGFMPDSKLKMLLRLKDEAEIVIVISADAIEKNKKRGDLGITYDLEVLRLIDAFTGVGLFVGSVCITQYSGQRAADKFRERLNSLNIKSYIHYVIPGYPSNVDQIVSDEGYGKNDYIETSRRLVVITAPGPGSGKMATCLSQLYQENQRGVKAGYAKFETFPIWNLPLKHPVNLAYEAATADLNDVNMIDPFHLEEYGVTTVNYNRDIEIFPVLNAIMTKIYGTAMYHSPTDMGVNMAGFCICDDEACKEASKQEVLRRYYKTLCQMKQGLANSTEVTKIEFVMAQMGLTASDRVARKEAVEKAEATGAPAAAIRLPDGRIVTGKTSSLLGASAALILNALKAIAGIPDEIELISPSVLTPVCDLKTTYLHNHNPRLHTDETLIALSICAVTDENAKKAIEVLPELKGLEAHSSVILAKNDENIFAKLGVNITYEPKYQTKKLYHK